MTSGTMCGHFKQKLASGEFCQGVHCSSNDVAFYEINALMGMDYVWIDTEHAAVSLPAIICGMSVLQARGVSAVIRIAKCDATLAKPYLDNGADGIVFPMVNTPEQAEIAVKACRYPPKGVRGYGPLRANAFGEMKAAEQIEFADDHVMPIIQIEHHIAIERLDEILSVDGVQYAVLGPMDLSLSVGKAGQLEDSEVIGMIKAAFDKCAKHNVKLGVSMGLDRRFFEYCSGLGAAFISAGNPYSFYKYALGEWLPGQAREKT